MDSRYIKQPCPVSKPGTKEVIMRRTEEWLNKITKKGFGTLITEGRTWAEVRFFHHKTGKLIYTANILIERS